MSDATAGQPDVIRGREIASLVGKYVRWTPRGGAEGPLPNLARSFYGRVVAVHEPLYEWFRNVDVDFQFSGTASGVYRVSSNNLRPAVHHPEYDWADDDEIGAMLLEIYCPVDSETWPCATKREHISEAEAARLDRWRERRLAKDRETWWA